jgi:hypothetical protein
LRDAIKGIPQNTLFDAFLVFLLFYSSLSLCCSASIIVVSVVRLIYEMERDFVWSEASDLKTTFSGTYNENSGGKMFGATWVTPRGEKVHKLTPSPVLKERLYLTLRCVLNCLRGDSQLLQQLQEEHNKLFSVQELHRFMLDEPTDASSLASRALVQNMQVVDVASFYKPPTLPRQRQQQQQDRRDVSSSNSSSSSFMLVDADTDADASTTGVGGVGGAGGVGSLYRKGGASATATATAATSQAQALAHVALLLHPSPGARRGLDGLRATTESVSTQVRKRMTD